MVGEEQIVYNKSMRDIVPFELFFNEHLNKTSTVSETRNEFNRSLVNQTQLANSTDSELSSSTKDTISSNSQTNIALEERVALLEAEVHSLKSKLQQPHSASTEQHTCSMDVDDAAGASCSLDSVNVDL